MQPTRTRTALRPLPALALALLVAWPAPARAEVVINEIMYHPPDDRNELQWVELLNTGPAPVDLAGWSFTQGLKFSFAKSTTLAPGALLIVARDLGGFRLRYGRGIRAVGDFDGQLSHGGEAVTLSDQAGRPVDSVKYDDDAPWPTSPDGGSTSLERIHPGVSGQLPENWAPSPMPDFRQAAGTPGQTNSAARPHLPPVISNVQFPGYAPGKPLPVSANIRAADGLRSAVLTYQITTPPAAANTPRSPIPPAPEKSVPLTLGSGSPTNGLWTASLPEMPPESLVRFRIQATSSNGVFRIHPHLHDSRPSFTLWTGRNSNPGRLPLATLVQTTSGERPGPSFRFPTSNSRQGGPGEPARGQSTLILSAPNGGPVRVFDHIRITPRQGGWKVRFNRDQPLDGLTTVNVFDEGKPRYQLSEYLSYELFRAAGVPTPAVDHWQVTFNGRPMGRPHLAVEQPNSSFFRRTKRDPESDLFKLLWYGQSLIEQHEKKNNPASGHAQLVEAVERLQSLRGAKQWEYIERHFHVDEFAAYYAVNMCIQNWDGFFNNYFVYREPGPEGRWGILPWDEDKTWGDHDGASAQYDWYSMPLTTGMNGDHGAEGGGGGFGGFGFNAGSWWRPPGVFSGPLLANPEFRQRFRARLQEICTTHFTVEKMEPIITRLEANLDSVVPTGRASTQFRQLAASFRRQVEHRRAFILRELPKDKR